MTYNVSSGTLNVTHSLTHSHICLSVCSFSRLISINYELIFIKFRGRVMPITWLIWIQQILTDDYNP